MPAHVSTTNRFLTAPVGRLFVANALPMMLVMLMNGLLNIVDAAFLGHFVGADALSAVSVIFPALMITIALSTLISGGMASLYARHLGAGRRDDAGAVFAGAHGLSLIAALILIGLFAIAGSPLTTSLADGRAAIAQMAHVYLAITICALPVQLLLGIHGEACRNEGKAGLMALLSVGVTLANIGLNYGLIVGLGLGVAGSAWGTVIAQALGLGVLILLRGKDRALLPLGVLGRRGWWSHWRAILALGTPVSLSFLGIALVSATVIMALGDLSAFADTVAAYGIVTRLIGLAFLPLMAIALATQTIVGNNVGAGLYPRSDAALRIALLTAFLYCACVSGTLQVLRGQVGALFVDDPVVIGTVGLILRPMMLLYVFTGPVLVLALYFQAIGQPLRAAALTLIKPFLLSPVLIIGFASAGAIWVAFPVADGLAALIAAIIVARSLRGTNAGFGLNGEKITA